MFAIWVGNLTSTRVAISGFFAKFYLIDLSFTFCLHRKSVSTLISSMVACFQVDVTVGLRR